jgi:DNA-binding response OmpR family regulator
MDARVLVVEDDLTVAEVVVDYLRHAGLQPRHATDGADALEIAASWRPDLVVLDLMLPGGSGLEVCRRLREAHAADPGATVTPPASPPPLSQPASPPPLSQPASPPPLSQPASPPPPLPVIMLTALGEESDRVRGLEAGADDYVTKPFSPRELTLRVQAVLRRARAAQVTEGAAAAPPPLRSGPVEVDVAARRARRDGRELDLTGREFDLLAFLVAHPGRAFSRADLLEQVWGWSVGDLSTITVYVRRLREKVEPVPTAPAQLQTVWGVGYRWEATAS